VRTIIETPSKKQPKKMYRIARITSNIFGVKSRDSTYPARILGAPVKPIAVDRNAAPTRINVIIQEVRTPPIKLAIKEFHERDFDSHANKRAPITPTVAASVGVA
jgi:hypothetical protein